MKLHPYADDCQIYVSVSVANASAAASRLSACIDDVNHWMSASILCLNTAKTQIRWLGSRQQLQKVAVNDISILATTVRVTDTARDLGIVIDSQLSLEAHVSVVRPSGYYQLRQLRPVIKSMPQEAAKMLVHAFISSRLDYCNSLLYGIIDGLLQK